MKKELEKKFTTQGRIITNKEGIYTKSEVNKAKDHKKERGKDDQQKTKTKGVQIKNLLPASFQ